jgi:hypothetical protein
MKEEQAHEKLLQALRDIEAQIESHVLPGAKPVMQAEVERLRSLSEQQKWILNACLMRIDRTILSTDTLGELILARVEELRVERKFIAWAQRAPQ